MGLAGIDHYSLFLCNNEVVVDHTLAPETRINARSAILSLKEYKTLAIL